MLDLVLAIGIMLTLALLAFQIGRRLAGWMSTLSVLLLATAILLLMLIYIRDIHDTYWLVEWIPHSGLIVFGNWLPLAASLLAGLLTRSDRIPAWRRIPAAIVLFGAGFYSLVSPLLGEPPRCGNAWDSGVSLQTTNNSCSPASAATLLMHHQIPATEAEMAELCLTREGTLWQGLYRGLKLKVENTDWDVQVFRCSSRVLVDAIDSPAILLVGLSADTPDTSPYVRDWGWIPGVSHSVVLLGTSSRVHVVRVGDPSIGREEWTMVDLEKLWSGVGLRLVPRRHVPVAYLDEPRLLEIARQQPPRISLADTQRRRRNSPATTRSAVDMARLGTRSGWASQPLTGASVPTDIVAAGQSLQEMSLSPSEGPAESDGVIVSSSDRDLLPSWLRSPYWQSYRSPELADQRFSHSFGLIPAMALAGTDKPAQAKALPLTIPELSLRLPQVSLPPITQTRRPKSAPRTLPPSEARTPQARKTAAASPRSAGSRTP